MKLKRVVITGLGAITPIGNNVADFWNCLVAGQSGASLITKFDHAKFKTHFACEVKGFSPESYFERKDLRKYDLYTQYAVAASEEALKQAELHSFEGIDRFRAGVIWASGYGGISTFEEQMKAYVSGDGTPRFNPFFSAKILTDIAAGVISMRFGLHGPNYATVSACASSNTAIVSAFDTIRLGKADIIVAGGSEAAITEASIGGFNSAQALSKRNESPSTASRPFDPGRDGFVMGEGAGALVLEEYEHALTRGATILAEIVGGGMAADAYHLTGTHPEGLGAVLGMRAALADGNVSPEEVDYINAHATSTPQGDISEMKAVAEVFGVNSKAVISATKSMTGHLLGAAGAIEAIASVMAIRKQCIPPTINTVELDPGLPEGLNILLQKPMEKEVNYVLNNTFGFGGHTASSLFKKFS